ncbi:acyl-CoA thioesterase [Rhodovulum steppense]|uniref:Acyl-CoA thioesterase FadM n=1 Tax=Rhodovulum steppense TaxID=540251 RepID=A0A4R1Z1V7_9RHOB|nr:acyl-CoA thioesterase [Rhodovulum steppense]TCM87612.1 acyl-CoA thioesterase FadM [Rhodovulum steppense]
MYPFLRLAKEFHVHRNAAPLPLTGTHVSHHMCWPWDLDLWMELNNGRTLTLLDLGRLPLAKRVGLIGALREQGWGLTMAGVTVRYRRRVRIFDRFQIRSRCVGWDARFIYIEQGMWRGEECCNHALYRSAVTDANGIVAPARVMEAMGRATASPPLPGWVAEWITAEAHRPWPPMAD